MTVGEILDIVRTAEHNEAQLRRLEEDPIDECSSHPVVYLSKTEVMSVIKTINDLLYIVKQTEVQ